MNNASPNRSDPPESLLSLRDAAARLGVSERHLRQLIADEGLPSVRLGRRVLIRPASLDRWLAQREETRRSSAQAASTSTPAQSLAHSATSQGGNHA